MSLRCVLLAALVQSRMSPTQGSLLGIIPVSNFWWHLGAVSLLAAATLLCGWLQGVFGWTPADVEIETPAPQQDHGHEAGHH